MPFFWRYSISAFRCRCPFVVQTAADFGDADDLVAGFVHQLGGIGTDVAEALHDDARSLVGEMFELFAGLIANDHHAASGRFAAAARAADVDRLAGDDRGHGLAHVHGVGVHHPRHDLLVGVDVGRGNVFLRTDELDEFGGVAAGHALEFAHRTSCAGSQMTPPFAPPNGMLTTAHFHVIQVARARTSSSVTSGE